MLQFPINPFITTPLLDLAKPSVKLVRLNFTFSKDINGIFLWLVDPSLTPTGFYFSRQSGAESNPILFSHSNTDFDLTKFVHCYLGTEKKIGSGIHPDEKLVVLSYELLGV